MSRRFSTLNYSTNDDKDMANQVRLKLEKIKAKSRSIHESGGPPLANTSSTIAEFKNPKSSTRRPSVTAMTASAQAKVRSPYTRSDYSINYDKDMANQVRSKLEKIKSKSRYIYESGAPPLANTSSELKKPKRSTQVRRSSITAMTASAQAKIRSPYTTTNDCPTKTNGNFLSSSRVRSTLEPSNNNNSRRVSTPGNNNNNKDKRRLCIANNNNTSNKHRPTKNNDNFLSSSRLTNTLEPNSNNYSRHLSIPGNNNKKDKQHLFIVNNNNTNINHRTHRINSISTKWNEDPPFIKFFDSDSDEDEIFLRNTNKPKSSRPHHYYQRETIATPAHVDNVDHYPTQSVKAALLELKSRITKLEKLHAQPSLSSASFSSGDTSLSSMTGTSILLPQTSLVGSACSVFKPQNDQVLQDTTHDLQQDHDTNTSYMYNLISLVAETMYIHQTLTRLASQQHVSSDDILTVKKSSDLQISLMTNTIESFAARQDQDQMEQQQQQQKQQKQQQQQQQWQQQQKQQDAIDPLPLLHHHLLAV